MAMAAKSTARVLDWALVGAASSTGVAITRIGAAAGTIAVELDSEHLSRGRAFFARHADRTAPQCESAQSTAETTVSLEGRLVLRFSVMANFLSNQVPAAFYNVRGTRDTLEGGTWRFSVGSTILARVQELLISWAANWGPTNGWEVDAYREGGPLRAPGTTIDLRRLAVDREHGPITNGALWFYLARKALPAAPPATLRTAVASADAGTRNALDKIEECLAGGELTVTAARAMLWVIEHHRDPSLTWSDFIGAQTPDFNRQLWRPYPLRRRLPLASTPAGLMILDTDAPQTRRSIAMVSLTHCLRIGDSLTPAQVKSRFDAIEPSMASKLGDNPRITRTYAGILESCSERVKARWPIVFDLPDPAIYASSDIRFARSIVDALRASMPDAAEWEISVDRFDAAVNGSVEQWSAGVLANTATRESPAAGVEENADGPTSLRPREAGTADKVVEALGYLAATATAVAGFWFGGKLFGAIGSRSTVTTKREVEVLAAPRANKPSKSAAKR